MESRYESLGFKRTEYVENPYGIKIYIGTKGKEDWCVEIPNELARKVCTTKFNYDNDSVIYLISEEDALRIAEKFTNLAKESELWT